MPRYHHRRVQSQSTTSSTRSSSSALPSTTMLTPSSTSTSPAKSTLSFGSQTSRSPAECRGPGWVTTMVRPPSRSVSAVGDGPVGRVGELEPAHRVETYDPHPIGDQSVLSPLRGEHPPVGMGDHLGPGLPEDDGAKVMIGVMVGEHQPLHGLVGDATDGLEELLALPRTGQGIDHDDALARHDEPGIGPALHPSAGVAHDGIDAGRELAHGEIPAGRGGGEAAAVSAKRGRIAGIRPTRS